MVLCLLSSISCLYLRPMELFFVELLMWEYNASDVFDVALNTELLCLQWLDPNINNHGIENKF